MATEILEANEHYKAIHKILQEVLGDKFSKFFPKKDYETPRDFRVSIPCLIETEDYSIFQSEPQRLDKATFARGIKYSDRTIERAEVHESKVKQEIRRVGKRLIRKLLPAEELESLQGHDSTDDADMECHIPDCLCGKCRDCRLWGFAARRTSGEAEGEQGKPAKIDVGTTFTIHAVDEIMVDRIGNAVDEHDRRVRQAFFNKEQVSPEVWLPYVIDLRDVTLDELLYTIYSLLNASRVGAGRTKGGCIDIQPLTIYFAYEQLFCNKKIVQHAYDYLWDRVLPKLDENRKRLGWLGEIGIPDKDKNENRLPVVAAIEHALNKELEKTACWFKPIDQNNNNNFENLLSHARKLFEDESAMTEIVRLST